MDKIYGRKGKSSKMPITYNQSLVLRISFDDIVELAQGKWMHLGFQLFKDSRIMQDDKHQKNQGRKKIIKDMFGDDLLIEEYPYFILKKNVMLHSPSSAASLVYGNSRNGLTSWKHGDKTLGELLDQES